MKKISTISIGLFLFQIILSQSWESKRITDDPEGAFYNSKSASNFIPFESNLPIIDINTLGSTIEKVNKSTAIMKVINKKNGMNNSVDITYEYNGYIGIEIRGRPSSTVEKLNYSFETRTETGDNLNVSLLDMPEENDWVLHGPYSDKSLMRNALAYHIGSFTGRWSPRTRFCELIINDDYRGIYVLIEKVKQDKNRVNIATLNPDETEGDDITGGYILKIDRPEKGSWISPYDSINISYADPKYEDMPVQQRNYIKNYVTDFENALFGDNFKDTEYGYQNYIDVLSFVDYYLVNELTRNVDAYRLSTYFYKDKNSNNPKIIMGPIWDFDISFGNVNYAACERTEGWISDSIDNSALDRIPFWWDRLMQDPYFETQLKNRWAELRSNVLTVSNINKFIDASADKLASAHERNFEKFQIINKWVPPNSYVGKTYADEIAFLKKWINERIIWMDSQLERKSTLEDTLLFFILPNPFEGSITLKFILSKNADINLKIRNILGSIVLNSTNYCYEGENEIVIDTWQLNGGENLYLYELYIDGEFVSSGKLLKK